MEKINAMLTEGSKVFSHTAALSSSIATMCERIEMVLRGGNKVLLAGNGGSATQATHIAAEFTGRYKLERRSLPAISLGSDLAAITAIANDYGYEHVFSRQLEGLGDSGDVVILLSTSGNSQNLINAIEKAKEKGIFSISLLGKSGGKMKGLSDLDIIVPSDNTPRIQEVHLAILHIICEIVEERMFP